MMVFLNGRLVPQAQATVSIFDRSFLYGDGLFETLRVVRGRPFRGGEHWERLQRGCRFLKIRLPVSHTELAEGIDDLVQLNQMSEAILRVTVSRGVGVRGYSPEAAVSPTLVMTLHPLPEAWTSARTGQPVQWKLQTSSQVLPSGAPLAHFKTANKLPQILARAEAAAAGADEALMRNSEGFVIEGSAANLFWIGRDTVYTAPTDSGILPGITRAVILALCRELGLTIREQLIPPAALTGAQGVFLTLSSLGVVEAVALDGRGLARSPLTQRLAQAYEELLTKH